MNIFLFIFNMDAYLQPLVLFHHCTTKYINEGRSITSKPPSNFSFFVLYGHFNELTKNKI